MIVFPSDNCLLCRYGCDTAILEFTDFKLGLAYFAVCRVEGLR